NFVFKDQTLKTRFGKGYFEIDQFKLRGDDFDLQTSMAIDINATPPKFDLAVKSENFNYISPNKIIIDEPAQMAQLQFSQEEQTKLTAFDQFLAFPSLEGFHGKIMVDFINANFDGFLLKNIKIDSKLRDGALDFTEFSSNVYDGNMTYKGGVGMKFDKSMSGNFSFNKIKLKPLLSDVLGIKTIDGVANIASSFSSYGNNSQDFIKNINSDAKFSVGMVQIEKYGLNDLIKKMFNLQYYRQDLKDLSAILFNENARTTIKQAVGSIVLNKGRDNKFKIDFSSTALNGVFSGAINFEKKSIDALANIIFLSGNRQKQIPLNIATNLRGNFNNILQNTNMDQALQYIEAANKQYDLSGNADLQFKEVQEIEDISVKDKPQEQEIKGKADDIANPQYIQKQFEAIQAQQQFVTDPALQQNQPTQSNEAK
ncbi:MAG TPA: AsmA family protein, partial [Rickettsiales bacterium]|nr:AsmA family protein [Rickettsiales bacterium]